MVQVVERILGSEQQQALLEYLAQDDHRTDQRPDVRTKHPDWNDGDWPKHLLEPLLADLLPQGYRVEEVTFIDTTIPFKLHVDSGDGGADIHKAILFPLMVDPAAQTVFFDNHWSGAKIKFSRDPVGRFHYVLPNRHGTMTVVSDMRELLVQLETGEGCTDFDDSPGFRNMLSDLISKRQGQALSPVPDSISDYSGLTNVHHNDIDPGIHQKYLQHLSAETLRGLTVSDVVEWSLGSAIMFDRTQLHCASHQHSRKIFVTVFTQHPAAP